MRDVLFRIVAVIVSVLLIVAWLIGCCVWYIKDKWLDK